MKAYIAHHIIEAFRDLCERAAVIQDPSPNDYADRLAAAHCVRANHIPTVPTPLEWKEVKQGLDLQSFTIHSTSKRLGRTAFCFAMNWIERLHLKMERS